ncbi:MULTISPECIES: hypothetical protein [unclassified Oceanobacter]|jgi:hypothetical protein|uniref:hypothetical protein n=1 Tax=unclassified Oceanobacter TaxID=2620260 RepID=UPI002736EAF8|nr:MULTISPECIES: hypothetical protein [unclassified Oceanobacter]MDP2506549.1 hypothetical protein [Oceanobacter sp. 3_MG-2023]MDP2549365.1 hypothetical protein [Oceanobacter sp. 4_MG-2023]
MALFRHNTHADIDPFTDLLFNALLTFTFLFLVALILLNPPARTGIVDPKAEFLITVSWPDGNPNDVDIWVSGPDGKQVSYKQPQAGLMHLDRDDRGMINDVQVVNGVEVRNPLNQEVLTIRGRPAGEYIVNLHYFKTQQGVDPLHSSDSIEVPATVYLAEVNPKMNVLFYHTEVLSKEGDEVTAFRFTITPEGKVTNINQLQKSLVRGEDK